MSLVEIENVHKSYGSLEVLRGVSLKVEIGETVAIIGRSGSGKSTLLRCINGLEEIQQGVICFDGQQVNSQQTDLRKLRQQIGIVFQSYNLFPHLNAERNITLALTVVKKLPLDEARQIAHKVMEQVGLGDKLASFPDMLSGGQQQRVAIARSLAMSPKLMLFDEITSALDPELIGEVLRVLTELGEARMTMILVTHEMGFARNAADRLVFMHEGEIWESGPTQDVLNEPKTPELKSFLGSVLI